MNEVVSGMPGWGWALVAFGAVAVFVWVRSRSGKKASGDISRPRPPGNTNPK